MVSAGGDASQSNFITLSIPMAFSCSTVPASSHRCISGTLLSGRAKKASSVQCLKQKPGLTLPARPQQQQQQQEGRGGDGEGRGGEGGGEGEGRDAYMTAGLLEMPSAPRPLPFTVAVSKKAAILSAWSVADEMTTRRSGL
ncbi:MAG: hypothetical protein FRX49_07405 [Trebouxia sp. A1-2]|nr:MAG: hypothetical protein FRX49_07405 [Trebouxia sp. A1-2]